MQNCDADVNDLIEDEARHESDHYSSNNVELVENRCDDQDSNDHDLKKRQCDQRLQDEI